MLLTAFATLVANQRQGLIPIMFIFTGFGVSVVWLYLVWLQKYYTEMPQLAELEILTESTKVSRHPAITFIQGLVFPVLVADVWALLAIIICTKAGAIILFLI